MLFKNLKIVALAGCMLAVFSSCSTEDEVFEEQKPQSEISAAMKQKLGQSANSAMSVATFQSQINWYQNFNPTTCGVEAMILALEVFDAQGNTLFIDIFDWEAELGSFENAVNERIDFYSEEYQQDVTIVFVSGIIFKLSAITNQYEYTIINSYTLFLDYFDNCQSNSVVFQVFDGGVIDWNIFDAADNADPVIFPQDPCLSLVFPLQILVATDNPSNPPFAVTVTETEFLNYLGDDVPNLTFIDFVYPLTLVSSTGTQFTVNNVEQLELLFEQQCD